MKFVCTVDYLKAPSKPWEETYDQPGINTLEAAEKWALYTVAKFNATLRPQEKPRKLIKVALAGVSTKHEWFKANLMTVIDPRLGLYDIMHCRHCDVTGKRFNLGEHGVKIDSKFRAKKYQICDRSLQ